MSTVCEKHGYGRDKGARAHEGCEVCNGILRARCEAAWTKRDGAAKKRAEQYERLKVKSYADERARAARAADKAAREARRTADKVARESARAVREAAAVARLNARRDKKRDVWRAMRAAQGKAE